jgi:hypothetical protein
MKRSPDLRRFAVILTRIESRATLLKRAVHTARERRRELVEERAERLEEASMARDAMLGMYATRGAMDKRQLFTLLQRAGLVRLRWREALAQAELLESDIERVEVQIDTSVATALAARRRADRLNAWLGDAKRKAEAAELTSMHDLIEEDAWKQRVT